MFQVCLFCSSLLDRFGVSSMHVTSECFIPFLVSFVVQKDSIFKGTFSSLFELAFSIKADMYRILFNLVEVGHIFQRGQMTSKNMAQKKRSHFLGLAFLMPSTLVIRLVASVSSTSQPPRQCLKFINIQS